MYIRYEDEDFEDVDAVSVIKGMGRFTSIKGLVRFYQTELGVYTVVSLSKLPSGEIFSINICHGDIKGGKESDNIEVYNFNEEKYPYRAGDMPMLFSTNGVAMCSVLTDRFEVSEIVGMSVIIKGYVGTGGESNGETVAYGIIQ